MTQSQEPTLAELIAESRVAAAEAVAEMAQVRAELAVVAAEQRAERESAERERAEKARSGELGPEMRRLQDRIDLGESSWNAVLSGQDESAEAQQSRDVLAQNIAGFGAEVDAAMQAEVEAGREDPRVALAATFAEIRVAVVDTIALQRAQDGENRGQ